LLPIVEHSRRFEGSCSTVAIDDLTTVIVSVRQPDSLFLAPISETYGRKPVYVIAMFFIVFVIPRARAIGLTKAIAIRFFRAVSGSAMITNAPNAVGDIIGDEFRALAFSIWSIGHLNGPGQYSGENGKATA
jgi:MFS family permease